MGSDQKPRPLTKLYDHAFELLAKARRDRDALHEAANAGHDVRDKVFDCLVTVYHVRDWVEKLHPNLKSKMDTLFRDPVLQACRDICNAHKHFELDYQPSVKDIDFSATPPVSAATTRLKVVLSDGRRIRVEVLADEAISALEGFFKDHDLG